MSKSSAPKKQALAVWIIAVVAVAALAVVVTGAGSRSHSAVAPRVSSQSLSSATSSVAAVTPATRARVQTNYAAPPLAFEANQGQTNPQVKYMARGNGYKLFLTSSHAIMTLGGRKHFSGVRDMMLNKRRGAAGVQTLLKKRERDRANESLASNVRMNLLGIDGHAQLSADNLQTGKVNYFIGRDPSKWRTNIPMYGQVTYRGVYPGVDLTFHGAAQQLEFDYLLSPGADASPIALSFEGADSIRKSLAGDLVLSTGAGPMQLHKPVAYQVKDGARQVVEASFVLKGKNEVAFALGPYDHNRELVIDPTVTYATYFGGDFADYGISVAVDASGNSYVAGATDSDTIPGPAGTTVVPNNNGAGAGVGFDTFVTKVSSTGTCVFTTFFGGSSDDFPGGIAIDSQGIYIAGTTDSSDFPATVGQTTYLSGGAHGNNDGYAVKLALATGALTWGTYIEGSDSTSGLGVAVDSSHNVYAVGETFAPNLGGALGGVNPLPSGNAINLGTASGADDGYVAKLNSGGTAYLLVSYIGGSSGDLATGVALDSSGNIYVSGETISTNLPVTAGVVQNRCGTDGNCNAGATGALDDAFVVSIKANLSGYNYVTYYGGSNVDDALAITADGNGNAFLTGATASGDFPTATPYQSALAGTQNAFVVELNASGSLATHATYFGGAGTDAGLGIALDSSDNVYLTGQTSSSSKFPLFNPSQQALSGSSDAFVSALTFSSNSLLFSTYLGGGGDEDQFAGSIGLDSTQNIYVTGDTDSGNGATAKFPVTAGAIDSTYGGGTCLASGGGNVPCTDAFVAAYGPATAPDFGIAATALSPSSVSQGGSATSTVTVTPINAYAGTVNLTCGVTGSGSPLPTCSLSPTSGNSSTLTVKTTGAVAAMNRPSSILYALWLPVVGLSLVGMRFSTAESRRRKLLGFLLLGLVVGMLFFLPACGGSNNSSGGGGGCPGCTPTGSYTVTVTGADSVNANLTHSVSPALTLTVN